MMKQIAELVVKAPKAVSVAEVFGPTIQGEGPDAGKRCFFIRFGGCDFKCSWCDSMHAVDPAQVRQLPKLLPGEITDKLKTLGAGEGDTIVFSGGNPALHDLTVLVSNLHDAGMRVTVETQGTKWKSWMVDADLIVCSPKPPSSGMSHDLEKLDAWITWAKSTNLAIKVVVGDDADYRFAQDIHRRYADVPFYVSVLNPAGSDEGAFDIETILGGYRALCERVMTDVFMQNVVVLPQLHTLAWGAVKGV